MYTKRPLKKDIVGKKYGSLTVLDYIGSEFRNYTKISKWVHLYLVQCNCGNERILEYQNIIRRNKYCPLCFGRKLRKNWEPVFDDNICKIPIGKNLYAIIDKEDYAKIKNDYWKLSSDNYVIRNRGRKPRETRLSRILMEAPRNFVVDHINHDLLDNRKCNLRICSLGDNLLNHKPRKSKTGITGVHEIREGKYQARIQRDGILYHLGVFNTIDKAIKVRKKAELSIHKEYRYQKN